MANREAAADVLRSIIAETERLQREAEEERARAAAEAEARKRKAN